MENKPETKYPRLYLRVSRYEVQKFLTLKDDHDLSTRDIIEELCKPCERCGCSHMTVSRKDDGVEIKVPRTLLSNRKI